MAQNFTLPDVGEGLTEAEIVQWHVKVGDQITVNQVLCEIETAKAVVELPAPFAGTVTALLVNEGDVVAVGSPIITVEDGKGAGSEAPAPHVSEPVAEKKPEPVLVGYGVTEQATTRRARTTTSAAPSTPQPGLQTPVLTKPPVRKFAKDHRIDLQTVQPTGPHNTITRDDVERLVGPSTTTPAPTRPGEVIQVRSVQRSMANAMVQSAFTAPHVTEWVEVDVTRTTEAIPGLRQSTGIKISPMLFACAGLIQAATAHPRINASWVETSDGAQIHVHPDVNLGIAVASPRGLVVPVIHQSQTMALVTLAEQINAIVASAREGKTTPTQLLGGTISVTNVGVFGVDGGTPILVPGQVAILAVGRVVRKPWVVLRDGQESIAIRDVMTLALSFDHRVVDGELGSKVLRHVADYMNDPVTAALLKS